jgi:hypothetical protein
MGQGCASRKARTRTRSAQQRLAGLHDAVLAVDHAAGRGHRFAALAQQAHHQAAGEHRRAHDQADHQQDRQQQHADHAQQHAQQRMPRLARCEHRGQAGAGETGLEGAEQAVGHGAIGALRW